MHPKSKLNFTEMSLCQPPSRGINVFLWGRCQVTPPWVKSSRVFPVWQSRAGSYQVFTALVQSTTTCTAAHWCTLEKLLTVTENINSIPVTSLHARTLVFRLKLKCSEWTALTWSWVMRHLFARVLGEKKAYNQQGRLLRSKTGAVICSG